MKQALRFLHGVTVFSILSSAAVTARAQQVTGTPGSPTATTTIDGRYIPAPPQKFDGLIQLNAVRSKPAWPATIVPPKGAPSMRVQFSFLFPKLSKEQEKMMMEQRLKQLDQEQQSQPKK